MSWRICACTVRGGPVALLLTLIPTIPAAAVPPQLTSDIRRLGRDTSVFAENAGRARANVSDLVHALRRRVRNLASPHAHTIPTPPHACATASQQGILCTARGHGCG